MSCHDIESLILAERDGALTETERAVLSDHVAACPACRQFRADLSAALENFQTEVAAIEVPDADDAWRDLRAELRAPAANTKRERRPFAPVIWFGAPLAAAAAIALAFISDRSPFAATPAAAHLESPAPDSARADFVEAGDTNASTMVYVDKDSGWLVVWASNADTKTSG